MSYYAFRVPFSLTKKIQRGLCNKHGSASEPNQCSLRHIYGVRRVQIILSTVVFWRSWQVRKPNCTCYSLGIATAHSSGCTGLYSGCVVGEQVAPVFS